MNVEGMFHFRLNPSLWKFEGDGQQIYRSLELADGSYLVSWKTNNRTTELIFTQEEVSNAMTFNHWIITDENGDF